MLKVYHGNSNHREQWWQYSLEGFLKVWDTFHKFALEKRIILTFWGLANLKFTKNLRPWLAIKDFLYSHVYKFTRPNQMSIDQN